MTELTLLRLLGYPAVFFVGLAIGNIHATRWAVDDANDRAKRHIQASFDRQRQADSVVNRIYWKLLPKILEPKVIEKEVIKYVPKYILQPTPKPGVDRFSVGFVLLHNAAARGEAPGDPPSNVGAPAPAGADTAAEIIARNYAGCLRDGAKLDWWQETFGALVASEGASEREGSPPPSRSGLY